MDIKSKFNNQGALGTAAIHSGKLLVRAFQKQFAEERPFTVDDILPIDRLRIGRELARFNGTESTVDALLAAVPEVVRRADACASVFAPVDFQIMGEAFTYSEGYLPGLSLTLQGVEGSECRNQFYVTVTVLLLSMSGVFTDEMLEGLVAGFPAVTERLVSVDLENGEEIIAKHAELLATADDTLMRHLVGLAGQPPRPYQGLESFFLINGNPVQITTRFYYNPAKVEVWSSPTDNVEPLR